MGQIERNEALDRARHHVAQNAWTPDCIDDAAFIAGANLRPDTARELAGWITWQRRYATHKATGMTDNEAWTAAARPAHRRPDPR